MSNIGSCSIRGVGGSGARVKSQIIRSPSALSERHSDTTLNGSSFFEPFMVAFDGETSKVLGNADLVNRASQFNVLRVRLVHSR